MFDNSSDAGQKGQKGGTGSAAQKGQKGNNGAAGQKGQKGATGGGGDKGAKGNTGGTGAKGNTGGGGNTGGAGSKGPTGNTGGGGDKGNKGANNTDVARRKAWAKINSNGNNLRSSNVSATSQRGTGLYRMTIATNLATSNAYALCAGFDGPGSIDAVANTHVDVNTHQATGSNSNKVCSVVAYD